MPATEGNINGPSMVRVPDWVPPEQRADPAARYYLYFASHWGTHIKLAWSEKIEGPYTIYNPGDGVFHVDRYTKPENLSIHQHVASPDIQLDEYKHQFIMYFHAGIPVWNEDTIMEQKTVVATSAFGLDFNNGLQNVLICPFYARIFEYNYNLYSLNKEGIHRAKHFAAPWEQDETFSKTNTELWNKVANPLKVIPTEVRHCGILIHGDVLHVMYSSYPSSPEHIEYVKIELSREERKWKVSKSEDILFSEYDWEGVNFPVKESVSGYRTDVHELRDPYLFQDDDDQIYLLYTGAGENGIGIARVDGLIEDRESGFSCSGSINIFPNPANGDYLTISGIENEATIKVFTLSGEEIYLIHVGQSESYRLKISGMQKGIILISILDGEHECWYSVFI